MPTPKTRGELIAMLRRLLDPGGLTEEESDKLHFEFIDGMPDPKGAEALLVVRLDGPRTAEALVDAALAMSTRRPLVLPIDGA